MYVVRVKPTTEPSDLHEFRPSSAAISEFDDDEEIVPERRRKQQRGRDEDTEMNEANPTAFSEELRTVDISSQLFLSSKRTRGEQLEVCMLEGAFLLALSKTVNASQTQRPRPTVKKVNK
jgi:hypothetical protein